MDSANDMKAAAKTYDGFTHMLKWGAAVVVIIVAFVVIAIAS